jgi:NADH-quinone oxidoreductase subunit C
MSDDTATTPAPEDAPAEEAARDEVREAHLASITESLGDAVVASLVQPGRDLQVRVTTEAWPEAARTVRHRLGARYFCFLSAIDWMTSPFGRSMDAEVDRVLGAGDDEGADAEAAGETAADGDASGILQGVCGGDTRFQVFARVAHVGEPGHHWGITLRADVPEDTLAIGSWTGTYAGADWHEREAWEMFGISFLGHPGLRHLYLPSGFEGHPLRKDFPLLARHVKPWPGIVDVEPMPTDDGDGEGGDDSAGSDTGGAA